MLFLHCLVKRNAHHTRPAIKLLEKETPEFIPPQLWPSNSPDLNSADCSMWVTTKYASLIGTNWNCYWLRTECAKLYCIIVVAAIHQCHQIVAYYHVSRLWLTF